MGVTQYGEQGRKALEIARSIERKNRAQRPDVLQDKVLAGLRAAGFSYDLAAVAAWEALSE
jgi:hypothetical protein